MGASIAAARSVMSAELPKSMPFHGGNVVRGMQSLGRLSSVPSAREWWLHCHAPRRRDYRLRSAIRPELVASYRHAASHKAEQAIGKHSCGSGLIYIIESMQMILEPTPDFFSLQDMFEELQSFLLLWPRSATLGHLHSCSIPPFAHQPSSIDVTKNWTIRRLGDLV